MPRAARSFGGWPVTIPRPASSSWAATPPGHRTSCPPCQESPRWWSTNGKFPICWDDAVSSIFPRESRSSGIGSGPFSRSRMAVCSVARIASSPASARTCTAARPTNIVTEARRLTENGYRELVLTGIHLGHYGVDMNRQRPKQEWTRLSHLLEQLVALPGDFRIRLSSIEAPEVTQRTCCRSCDTMPIASARICTFVCRAVRIASCERCIDAGEAAASSTVARWSATCWTNRR